MWRRYLFLLMLVVVTVLVVRAGFFGSGFRNVEAPVGPVDQDQVIEHFELEGFDPDGSKAWKLVGETAHVKGKGDVFIEKNVVLTLKEGIRIEADKVLWQSSLSRFITNADVRVTHRDMETTGRGAIGRLDERMVQINQNIRMTIRSGGIVTARGPMKIFQKQNRVILYRDVWILDEKGSVSADRMDAFYGPESRKIISVMARGHVRISHGQDVSYSEVAVYDTRSGSVRLEGSPEIYLRETEEMKEKYSTPAVGATE